MAKTFTWTTAPKSGLWNAPANWTNNTDGTVGTLAPGAADTVSVPGGAGDQFQIVGGPGAAAALSTYGNNAFTGSITAASLAIGSATAAGAPAGLDNSDALDLERGAALAVSGGITLYADFEADGGALKSGAGFDVLSGVQNLPSGAIADDVVAVNGGAITAATELTLNAGEIIEDQTATVEVGTAGGAAAGVITVDNGGVLTLGGTVSITQAITDNGDVVVNSTAAPGVTINQSITGTGAFDAAASAQLSAANASFTGLSRLHLGSKATASFFGGSISSVGAVTLDMGASLSTTGNLVNDGPITLAASAALTAASISGASTIAVGAGGSLTVTGTLSGLSGVTMGNSSILTLSGSGTPMCRSPSARRATWR